MDKVLMIGCDLHDVSMRLRMAEGTGESMGKSFFTADTPAMIVWVKELAAARGAGRIILAYEASGRGFGLYDELTAAGIECHVLAPTHLPHTSHGRKNKTDDKDALMLLDQVRGHVLAGNKLPTVWVPDRQTRDDREAVRMRLGLAEQRTRIKNQIRTLAKRAQLTLPEWFTASGHWSKRSLKWLRDMARGEIGSLGEGQRTTLATLIDVYEEYSRQLRLLDEAVDRLAQTERYSLMFRKLTLMPGVGNLTAMVFLTEMGRLDRFANRRQLAAYLGLAPASFESGERSDRKGHITHQGPARVRHVLCQAAWAGLRCSEHWRAQYDRIRRGSPKRSRIAIVALMRRLAITMWQKARSDSLNEVLAEIEEQKASTRARPKGRPFVVA